MKPIPIRLICHECAERLAAAIAADVRAEPSAEHSHAARCAHHSVGVLVRSGAGGEILGWTLWSAPTEASFHAALAFDAGIASGLASALEAEAAAAKAAGAH